MKKLDSIRPGSGEEIIEKEKRVSPRSQSRRVALQALYQWQMTFEEPAVIIRQFQEDQRLNNLDLELFKELFGEVVSQAESLDEIYGSYLDRAVSMIDPVERAIMRLGVYELKNKPEIPYRVIINEAVELAKRFGAEESHKYVNGILDKAAKALRPHE
ncbi:transcription antitermination factor NusB [Thiomicrorhabdus heinhorstiae]|uniref:transcription antitermination factor NusB n=1 Tax=Thiomicrorhabdus heinhorstiae TaxID=2748010 RepID=UPI001E4E0D81|nr:transcription antitermination factor NusB [Thiomicrorhabdus heinhorstiae]